MAGDGGTFLSRADMVGRRVFDTDAELYLVDRKEEEKLFRVESITGACAEERPPCKAATDRQGQSSTAAYAAAAVLDDDVLDEGQECVRGSSPPRF